MAAQHTMASWEEPPLPRSFDSVFYGAAGTDTDTGPSDDEFNRVSFLSHFEGANNGVNNAFDDGSADNLTITAVGNATQGSFGPFARPDGEFGVSFDGDRTGSVANYLDTPAGADFELDANYTIEGWFFQIVREEGSAVFELNDYRNGILFRLGDASSNYDNWYINGTDYDSPASSFPLGQWNHFAITRDGSTNRLFANGVQIATASVSGDINSTQGKLRIGGIQHSTGQQFVGVVSNFRLIKGTALYTSNFTPSTSKLTAVTNTKLLTCQSNRFVDNSASAHTLTPSGKTAVSAFGPFLSSSVYSAGTNGASAYMDGSGDYLTTPYASSIANWYSTDYTIEAWVYYTAFTESPASPGHPNVLKHGQTGSANDYWSFGAIANGTLKFYYFNGSAIDTCVSTATLSLNTWHHIAMCHDDSDNEINLYLDGVSVKTHTVAGTPQSASSSIIIMGEAQSSYFTGYMNDLRVINGTEVYTSNFTPPTAPLTAITNTKLLLNMADGQAIDSAAQNNLTLDDNTKISNGQAKFGDTSLLFDGTNDYATTIFKTSFGAGNFTIEYFFRVGSVSTNQNLFQFGGSFLPDDDGGPGLGIRTSRWRLYTGANTATHHGSAGPSNDTWYHIAVVRNGTTTKLYVDGVEKISVSDSYDYSPRKYLLLGGGFDGSYDMNGYMDEFRVSYFARYTSNNFTVPSEPFADKGR